MLIPFLGQFSFINIFPFDQLPVDNWVIDKPLLNRIYCIACNVLNDVRMKENLGRISSFESLMENSTSYWSKKN